MVPVSSELTLEHVVIRVDDLDAAMKDFAALGFHVVYGGVHSSGVTHNALIHFQNGTFLELVAYRKPMLLTVLKKLGLLDLLLKNTDNHVKYRFTAAVGFPEGFMDAALLSRDIEQDTRLANDRGLKTTKPMPFQRKKPNGDTVHWNIMCRSPTPCRSSAILMSPNSQQVRTICATATVPLAFPMWSMGSVIWRRQQQITKGCWASRFRSRPGMGSGAPYLNWAMSRLPCCRSVSFPIWRLP